ncbi:hypothetical protein MJD09_21685 [bacterium]|nr:hypothetical protein [bacterium]
MPPSLIEGVRLEKLIAFGPSLIGYDPADEKLVAAQVPDFFDLQISGSKGKIGDRQTVCGGFRRAECCRGPIEIRGVVIRTEAVDELGLFYGNAAECGVARASQQWFGCAGVFEREREALPADGAEQIHRDNVGSASVGDTHQKHRSRTDIEREHRVDFTCRQLMIGRGGVVTRASSVNHPAQILPPQEIFGQAVVPALSRMEQKQSPVGEFDGIRPSQVDLTE